ncbi:MAG: hypothetical protein VYC39_20670 [Myxococcota bacterium]|nr:hypothetical protein [Myxococcota bacterium]
MDKTRLEHFRSTRIYEGQIGLRDVITELSSIEELDKKSEKETKKWTTIMIIVGFLGFFGAFGFLLRTVGVNDQGATNFLTVGLLVWLYFVRRSHKRLDVVDRRYRLVRRTLELLSSNIEDAQLLDVKINLNNPERSETELPTTENINGWKVKFFEEEWANLSGRFSDGTRFQFLAAEKFQRRTKWKRSRSGKNKRKTKSKSTSEFTINLKVKPSKYPHLERLEKQSRQAIQLPHELLLRRFSIKGNSISLTTRTKASWDLKKETPSSSSDSTDHIGATLRQNMGPKTFDAVGAVASMFLSLYQVLNFSRKLAKSRSAS